MANPEKGEFDVVVNGKTYTLTLKTAALMALQKHFGVIDLDPIFHKVMEGSIEHSVAFLWACLRKYHGEITFDECVNWVDDASGINTLMAQFGDLADSAHPDPADLAELPKPEKTPRPRKARVTRGTGGNGISRLAASA